MRGLVRENVLQEPSQEKSEIALNTSKIKKKVRNQIMSLWHAVFCSHLINEHHLIKNVLSFPHCLSP